MPGIDRTTIITGPAIVQFGGSSFWSKGDVMLKPVFKRFPIETAHAGKVDERFSDRRYEVSFEPAGQFTTALAAVLWPYQTPVIGTSLFGATDSPLVVWGQDGIKVTIHNAAITQMPNIRFGVDKTTIGQVKFTGLLAKSTDPTNAAAYYTIATATHPGHTGFAIGEIWTTGPQASWGLSPWDSFLSESGWEIAFNLKLAEQAVDGLGTVDITLQGLDISAKATPVGPTVAQVLTAMQAAAALGTSLGGGEDLAISAIGGGSTGMPRMTVGEAALVDADIGYGATRKRLGVCEWIGTGNAGFVIEETP